MIIYLLIRIAMRLVKHFSCLICLIWAIACDGPQPVQDSRQDSLAKGLCSCTENLLALNQQAQQTSDSLAFRKIAEAFDQSLACAQKLGIKAEDKPLLSPILTKNCPALANEQELLTELLGFAW